MKRSSTNKIVFSALFAALIFIGTQFIKIPLSIGYIHIGDTFILLAGYYIGGYYAVISSIIGSVLADILSGYIIYAPATLIIKGLMAIIIFVFCKRTSKNKTLLFVLGSALAEAVMILGYLVYDFILYGPSGIVISLSGNLLQGAGSVIISTILLLLLKKSKISKLLK